MGSGESQVNFGVSVPWAAAVVLALLSGCAQPPKTLYFWENFPRQQYAALLREGTGLDEQIRVMEAHAEKARAANAALPPGFRAHLGLLHLSSGNSAAARQMWQAEKLAFPESSPYMDKLLLRLDSRNQTPNKENPA
jgi:hypothetical protein